MPVEIIGEVGTPGANPEWISAQATLAILQLESSRRRRSRPHLVERDDDEPNES